MSKSNQFRQYAEEAMRSADQSKIQKEKGSFSGLPAHGPKLRCRANAFLSSAAVRLSTGPRKQKVERKRGASSPA